ncbi:acetyl-CoA C-acetyltransferase [soil metagenome]
MVTENKMTPKLQGGNTGRAVYIVDGCRSPFLKATGSPGPFAAADLAVMVVRELLLRQTFSIAEIDEVITGCCIPGADEANISRIIALRSCGRQTPAWTVQRNCGSGMQALDSAMQSIALGRSNMVLAGGVDVMSRAPLLYSLEMAKWLAGWYRAKTLSGKLHQLLAFRPHLFKPVISLLRGLTDPTVGLSMGQTAENLAYQFNISRSDMDAYALLSHQRLAQAQDNHQLTEIIPIYNTEGKAYSADEGLRRETNIKKLAELPPIFDKYGKVTAGNSSQVTDGAAFLLLASEEAVKQYNLPVLGRIVDVQWSALDPAVMGLGPVYAATPLLLRNNLTLSDIDYWEINEAFAAQILACTSAWQDSLFCQQQLGLKESFGKLDHERLNVDGGSIALGHPIGASGARIVLHLLQVLKRNNAKRGVAALCIGGGQGGAMLIER